ncbi:hypothetical protein ACWFRJ_32170 [Streptomyces sp. NPDC055239]
MLYLLDGGALSHELQAQIKLQASEIKAYGFHDVGAVDNLTIPRLARRICAAMTARQRGGMAYLEHGVPPGH